MYICKYICIWRGLWFALQLIHKNIVNRSTNWILAEKWMLIMNDPCPNHWRVISTHDVGGKSLILDSPQKRKESWNLGAEYYCSILLISPLGCLYVACSTLVSFRQWHSLPKKGKLLQTTQYNRDLNHQTVVIISSTSRSAIEYPNCWRKLMPKSVCTCIIWLVMFRISLPCFFHRKNKCPYTVYPSLLNFARRNVSIVASEFVCLALSDLKVSLDDTTKMNDTHGPYHAILLY